MGTVEIEGVDVDGKRYSPNVSLRPGAKIPVWITYHWKYSGRGAQLRD